MMLPSVTSGRSLKEKTIGFTQQMKNLLWLAWFCVAFVRNNTVMQKTGHLTGGRREESK